MEQTTAAYNLRDLGGLPTEDGRVTRPGVLYRAATLHDYGTFNGSGGRAPLPVRAVIDLRTPEEIAAHGGASAAGWRGRYVNLPVEPPPLPPAGPADLVDRYFAYLERSTASIIAALRVVAGDGYRPVVIHCTSGKDRTGVVTALLLRLVGVTKDAVAADYAASAPNMAAVLERLGRRAPGPLLAADIPPGILEARETTIRTFLERFDQTYGGVGAWAGAHGLEPSAAGAFQAAFIRSIR